VQKPCLFVFGAGQMAEQCLASELSSHGARVLCSPAFTLPASCVQLLFISERLLQPVEVRWRNGASVGLAFRGEAGHLSDQLFLEAAPKCPTLL
jgi:hypothetical protein